MRSGIAKLVRHWILIPACVGSSPTTLTRGKGLLQFLLFYFYFFVFAGATFLLWLFFMLCLLNLDLVLLLKLFLPISLGFCFLLLIFCTIVLFANIRVKSVLYLLVSSRLRLKT